MQSDIVAGKYLNFYEVTGYSIDDAICAGSGSDSFVILVEIVLDVEFELNQRSRLAFSG